MSKYASPGRPGLKPESTHTLIARLVDNTHVPLMPMIASEVKVRIGK
jgi:hypothetical protein